MGSQITMTSQASSALDQMQVLGTPVFCFQTDAEAHMLPYRFCTKQSRLTLIVPTFSKKGILQIIRGASI